MYIGKYNGAGDFIRQKKAKKKIEENVMNSFIPT